MKKGVIFVPGSKSYTNRCLIMAALTKGAVSLKNPLYSEDTEAMIGCLRTLGLTIETLCDQIVVSNAIDSVREGGYELFARDSGTTVRFITALSCIVPGIKTIYGTERLNERPIRDLVDGLGQMGARIELSDSELPLKVFSSELSGSAIRLRGDLSSQFLSALLLISPHLREGLSIEMETPLISKPYIDMTIGCMSDWGVEVIEKEGRYFVPPGQSYRMSEYRIEGDFSSASYFFAIAALKRERVEVENLNPLSKQADRKFLELLETMGNRVSWRGNRLIFEGKGIGAQTVDMGDCPDQAMTMAVLGAFAEGVTRISGLKSLRLKECDRIEAVQSNLGKMGIRVEVDSETLLVYGGNPRATEIETYGDHRIAMAFAVAKERLPGLVIKNREVVNKTFPEFWSWV